jgi:hypothetical protein
VECISQTGACSQYIPVTHSPPLYISTMEISSASTYKRAVILFLKLQDNNKN